MFCNQRNSEKSALYKPCNEHAEDQGHVFLVKCEILDSVRTRILECIAQLLQEDTGIRKSFYSENFENQLNILSIEYITEFKFYTDFYIAQLRNTGKSFEKAM